MKPTAQDAARDALVAQHLPLVRRVAHRLLRDSPAWMPLDDLVACGQAGLLEAASRYDPAQNASFATYAYYRVRGAMFDFLRQECAQSPYFRARASAQSALDALIEQRSRDQAPAPAGSADAAAEAAQTLAAVLDDAVIAFSLGEIAAQIGPEIPDDPAQALAARQERQGLDRALGTLPRREREMIVGIYLRDETIEHVGRRFGLTKSWASRLHARALQKLRAALAAQEPEDPAPP